MFNEILHTVNLKLNRNTIKNTDGEMFAIKKPGLTNQTQSLYVVKYCVSATSNSIVYQ